MVPQVDFVSLGAHGLREVMEVMVVKAEVTVNGGLPAGDRPVRYLFLTTKVGGGWMVMSETTAFRYYAALVD